MALIPAELSIEISATPQECYRFICNFEKYVEWASAVKKVNIIKIENNRPKIVEYIINLGLLPKDFRYVLNYKYDDTNLLLSWTYVEGSLRDVQGEYLFKPAGQNRTKATYKLAVDPGFWVPEIIKNKIINIAMKGSMEEFRKAVESKRFAIAMK